jgi:D-alanyl-D-alanine carboxypeptidase (penicillin-binding protein 5/6)
MKKNFTLCFFLFLGFSFGVFGFEEKNIQAKSAILINGTNGRVLFSKNADAQVFPASITKIATALFVLDTQKDTLDQLAIASPDALHTISEQTKTQNPGVYPAYWLEEGGTHIGILRKEKIPIRTLLYGMMLSSGNDAANVLAEHLGGKIPLFMDKVNEYLKKIGCTKTCFVNPHGLHDSRHITTARDMAQITKKALSNQTFQQIVSSLSYTKSKTNLQEARELFQYNRLLKKGNYFYPYAIGVKTGYTSKAGYNLVAAAKKEGRLLIAVLLGEEKNQQRYIDAKKLFEEAFAEKKCSEKVVARQKTFSAKIKGAASLLTAELQDDVVISYYPSEKKDFKFFIHWQNFLLPIQKGQKVGELWVVTEDEEVLTKAFLFAQEKIEKSFWHQIVETFQKPFKK